TTLFRSGHELEILADSGLEIDCGEVRWAPWPSIADRHLVGVCPEPCDQLAQILFRRSLVGDQQLMIARQQRDRLEVLGEVGLQRIDGAVDEMGAEIAEYEGVAVRCRAHYASGCDAARGAGDRVGCGR